MAKITEQFQVVNPVTKFFCEEHKPGEAYSTINGLLQNKYIAVYGDMDDENYIMYIGLMQEYLSFRGIGLTYRLGITEPIQIALIQTSEFFIDLPVNYLTMRIVPANRYTNIIDKYLRNLTPETLFMKENLN
jgi:hypothetical protein